ncbi:MAG: type II toxin-antitoxin system RelE/ParE family toxin [Ilumatobacteraceae bacterium]
MRAAPLNDRYDGSCNIESNRYCDRHWIHVMWVVIVTPEFEQWFKAQSEQVQDEIAVAVGLLKERGPTLGRPFADSLRHTSVPNLKELRPRGAAQTIRILFAFDPSRRAVLLVGGDKSVGWSRWYPRAIREAEALWARHLRNL